MRPYHFHGFLGSPDHDDLVAQHGPRLGIEQLAGPNGDRLVAWRKIFADALGVRYASRAGWDPAGIPQMLTTLGRIVKTIFILRYIHEEKIRRRVQLQLNRGEARHELARWLFFANRGEFRIADYEEIMNKASCLSLLSNAVLVWNTIKIGNIVGQLRAAGEQIDDADLSRVSPLAHRHVIPNGTYFHNQAVGNAKAGETK